MLGRAVLRVWFLLVFACGAAGAAYSQNYDFSYTSSGISVAGTFVTTFSGTTGRYRINSILNGTRDGNTMALIGFNGFNSNDNLLFYPSSLNNPDGDAYVDLNGVSYASNGLNYNLYYDGAYRESDSNGNGYAIANVQVGQAAAAPAPVPGGGPLSFLALGLAGLVWCGRAITTRRRSCLACEAAG